MRFGFTVDFAMLLYDEFDGSAINDVNVLFRCDGRIVTPLRKREGFYVFHDLPGEEWEMSASRPHYMTERFTVRKKELVPGDPVVSRRLLREHPGIWTDCGWAEGASEPDQPVLALSKEPVLRLQSVEGRQISVIGYGGGRLVGRRFALGDKKPESFVFLRQLSPGVYLADRELERSWKSGDAIYRSWLSRSGCDGGYHIPVEEGLTIGPGPIFVYDGGSGKWRAHASATARS